MLVRLMVVLGLIVSVVTVEVRAAGPANDVGTSVADFTLDNSYGKQVSLSDYADSRLVVLAFLGTECPLAKLYAPRLSAIQDRFASEGLVVIGINSNKQDSLSELQDYVQQHKLTFPMLKDVGNRVADAVGATRTPEVLLLDAERVVRYHGRIDDQYGIGYARETPERADLAVAIEEMIGGRAVSVPEATAVGCYIGRVKDGVPVGEVTYNEHIAPILNARCVSCHREQEIAPFTLTSYEDILGWEETILEVIAENRMPPWPANPAHGTFANDARLSDQEKSLIQQWVANGMPQGDPEDLPEPPQFVVGWRIPEPDQVVQMRDTPFPVPAEGVVDYQRFVVDPGWDEDKYIDAAEARPQNRGIVHHILVYVIPPGKREADLRQALAGYAPGSLPVILEDGVAMYVQAGSKLLFEMHYTPNGVAQTDLSYVGFCFTQKESVNKILQGRVAVNGKFRIPPGAASHPVTADYHVDQDEMLVNMTPHMHLRGAAFRYEAWYPSGAKEILLDVPKYDFNWQLKYVLAEPKLLPKGTIVRCTAIFDNSEKNPANPDPTATVGWGDQSWDEMMIGFMDTIPAS